MLFDSAAAMPVIIDEPTISTFKKYEHHPLTENCRTMSQGEFCGLMTSMKKNGQLTPITLYQGQIIDGRSIQNALLKLGTHFSKWKVREVDFKNDDLALRFIDAANVHRRHETKEDKRKHALKWMAEYPKFSNSKIAVAVGIDDKTVAKIRREEKAHSEFPNVEEDRVDALGRKSPAHKKRKSVPSAEWLAKSEMKKGETANWKTFLVHLTAYLDTFGEDEDKIRKELIKIDHEIVGRINAIRHKNRPEGMMVSMFEKREYIESNIKHLRKQLGQSAEKELYSEPFGKNVADNPNLFERK